MTDDGSFSGIRNRYNSTLLHVAAAYNNTSCLRVLLKLAPHLLNAVVDVKYTPVMLAVCNNHRDAVKMLLRAGVDVRAKSNGGQTVFDYARRMDEMLQILKQHQHVIGIF